MASSNGALGWVAKAWPMIAAAAVFLGGLWGTNKLQDRELDAIKSATAAQFSQTKEDIAQVKKEVEAIRTETTNEIRTLNRNLVDIQLKLTELTTLFKMANGLKADGLMSPQRGPMGEGR